MSYCSQTGPGRVSRSPSLSRPLSNKLFRKIVIFHPADSFSSSKVSLQFKDKLSAILLTGPFSLSQPGKTNINLDWKEE